MNDKPLFVAIVEDNPDLRDELQFQLTSESSHVAVMGDGNALDDHLLQHPCDIVILDIGLPGEDGLSIAERLHKTHPKIGIIILTARSELDSRLEGLQRGADIYLVKPVSSRELQAQIEALSRRIKPISVTWQLKQAGRELISPQGVSIYLTHMESSIMTILSQNPSMPVSRKMIIKAITIDESYTFDPRRIEVCISRLRQKIQGSIVSNSNSAENVKLPLKTVRSVGYIFTQQISIEK